MTPPLIEYEHFSSQKYLLLKVERRFLVGDDLFLFTAEGRGGWGADVGVAIVSLSGDEKYRLVVVAATTASLSFGLMAMALDDSKIL